MSNNDPIPVNNGAIHATSQIIKAVMSSAAEAEIGALYINCRETILSRHTLEFLGHKQSPTSMQTNNTTALGVVNNNVMKKLKAVPPITVLQKLQDRVKLLLPIARVC